MTRLDNHQLIEDLAYTIIAQTASDELPFFQAINVDYFNNPRKMLTPEEGKDEKLGFGLGELNPLLTPVVLFMTQEAITMVRGGITNAVEEEGKDTVSKLMKKVFKRMHKQKQDAVGSLPTLTADQLMLIRTQAYETARKLKTPDKTAQLLADALIGSLVKRSAVLVDPPESAT